MAGSMAEVGESQLLQCELESELKCPLCREFMDEATTTSCGHSFCNKCIKKHLRLVEGKALGTCPVCRLHVTEESLTSNHKLTKIASIFRAKKNLQVKTQLEHKNELGYEMLYYFLQYSKAKQMKLLHEVKNRVLSLEEDCSAVRKHLEQSKVLEGAAGGKTDDPRQVEAAIQQKVREDLRHYPHLVSMMPNLENLYEYNQNAMVAGMKRRAGAVDTYAESLNKKRREQYVDKVANTLLSISKHNKLKLEVEIPSGDMLQKSAIISSIGFNNKQEYFATAGVSKRIKIYDIQNVLEDRFRIPCPILELTWRTKLSDFDWNKHHAAQLATSDYDGMISVWDIDSGENIQEYDEHEKRAWSVDFCKTDASLLASGSDDGTVKIYSMEQTRSVLTVETIANVCSVQFHPTNLHYIAVGCSDHNAYVYDLRNVNQPVTVLSGHKRAISYAAYSKDSELLTASTDNTLRLWNVVDGTTTRVLSGHMNQKHFVGLAIQDDWISCGSETNDLHIYNKSLENPLFSYSFDSESNNGSNPNQQSNHFISATCWKPRSNVILSASSDGNLRVLKLCNTDEE
jgi:E3 ubiquitin-protein ligase RFWD2